MQIIDSIRLWSSNKSTRAGVTPRIITPLKIYPGRFWDLPESTPGLNLGYNPGYIMAALMIHPSIPGSTPFLWFGEVSSDPRIYPPPPPREYTPLFNNYMRPFQNLPSPLSHYWFLIIDNHVKNRKCGNFVSISSLTGECAAQKL